MSHATIGPIAVYLPAMVESNEQLAAQFPRWDMRIIEQKTGIAKRHIAGPDECVSDLAVAAAEKLFTEHNIDRQTVDFLLLCTQTPDYPLPTTACLVQDRLRLPTSTGALDFNLGCSGFVYGLSLAEGLIASRAAKRVLLITSETYSKYIDAEDRSLRTIFGDGAAATLIDAAEEQSLSSFRFGTDGSGADMLMLTRSGVRSPETSLRPRKRQRWKSDLYMDGQGLVYFTVEKIPELLDGIVKDAGIDREEIDLFLMHQPTRLLLERLRETLDLDETKLPMDLESCGNTVSSTIPILINDLRASGDLKPGMTSMLVGFGVGLSWAGCLWKETGV
ncbi:MAG: ketoacyl-ACP synthase III [Pirellulales bacterium]|nr:ketoacyl-ACP synthase III [Pirellulales bacterium]